MTKWSLCCLAVAHECGYSWQGTLTRECKICNYAHGKKKISTRWESLWLPSLMPNARKKFQEHAHTPASTVSVFGGTMSVQQEHIAPHSQNVHTLPLQQCTSLLNLKWVPHPSIEFLVISAYPLFRRLLSFVLSLLQYLHIYALESYLWWWFITLEDLYTGRYSIMWVDIATHWDVTNISLIWSERVPYHQALVYPERMRALQVVGQLVCPKLLGSILVTDLACVCVAYRDEPGTWRDGRKDKISRSSCMGPSLKYWRLSLGEHVCWLVNTS